MLLDEGKQREIQAILCEGSKECKIEVAKGGMKGVFKCVGRIESRRLCDKRERKEGSVC